MVTIVEVSGSLVSTAEPMYLVVTTIIVHGQSWITGLPCLIDCKARIEF